MTRSMIVVSVVVLSTCSTGLLAACPAGLANEIFCEDFDTYCQGGGYPGSPDCAAGALKNDTLLQTVWQTTSVDESTATACGTTFIVETDPFSPKEYVLSMPFAGRHPALTEDQIGQQTVSNWNVSPATPGIGFRIQSVFGTDYGMVQGTDENPLVLQFYLSGIDATEWGKGGGLSRTPGYLELAKGNDRANTDHVMSHYCGQGGGYCNPAIGQGPFPILCANGNPEGPLDGTCPPLLDAPVHAALAIGTMTMLDNDPCHCGVQEHGPQNWHLAIFDGQLWWTLRSGSPRPSGGTITPVDGAPMPPPPDPPPAGLNTPGDFGILAGKPDQSGPSNQWVKLTIRTSTFDVEMIGREKSGVNGYLYDIKSEMLGIPRKYLGCFDQLRGGVGAGCTLSSTSWQTCTGARKCIVTHRNNANGVVFDDVVLNGGSGCSERGACCMPGTGNCVNNQTEFECTQAGGTFRGENTTCGADDAICKGACCHTASCEDGKRINECPSANWQGYGTTCAEPCPCVGHFADIDADGDVDQADFSVLQSCFEDGTAGGICVCFDKDANDIINLDDVADFEACASGPGVPFSPNCDQ